MAYTRKYTFAPLPYTNRGNAVKLGSDPKGKTFLYTNGKSVFIRDIENPALATEYVGHKAQATVARYSPSGFYVASGDAHGNVRIWDTVNEEHILKSESRPITANVTDIAWDSESKRLIAVGDGKTRFGHAFLFDTLSSVGEISGHAKVINSVSIRQQRPFRAVTASDDMTVSFYNGVPFRYQKSIQDHTRFVNAVAFSPNGDFFVSAGADAKLFLYDGSTGDKIHELAAENGHTGNIFSVSWSPDSTQLLTSSADRTAKIWDVSAKAVVNTFEINSAADAVENQQVGNLWQGDWTLSVSLSGEFNYLDKNSGKVSRTVDGHSKAITALTVSSDDTLFTGSYDGRVYAWNYGTEDDKTTAKRLGGESHINQVIDLLAKEDKLYSAGMDDMIRTGSVKDKSFSGKITSSGALPRSLSASDNKVVVATVNDIQIYDAAFEKILQEQDLGFTPSVAAVDPSAEHVFVGGEDNKVRVYQLNDGKLSHLHDLSNNLGNITALAVHPTLPLIAVGDTVGKIFVYDYKEPKVIIQQWVFHTARILSLQWSACGMFLVSGSLDTNIYVWNRERPLKKVGIKNAHVDAVNGVSFLHKSGDKLSVVSVGQDAATRVWEIAKPE
ncbi:WD repeat-containing protein 1 [Apophysomyces sp. BC1034]|nr:WD repeat-containing protein 1 [Apophysomyces sp. BC1015]KAG0171596.1 WD repeat-containing protein 1 [Apophysomyces sp. BC1021]KAG0184919.1 WD repeat-containing protein 1 [Apophysomyces sp. BC1034]